MLKLKEFNPDLCLHRYIVKSANAPRTELWCDARKEYFFQGCINSGADKCTCKHNMEGDIVKETLKLFSKDRCIHRVTRTDTDPVICNERLRRPLVAGLERNEIAAFGVSHCFTPGNGDDVKCPYNPRGEMEISWPLPWGDSEPDSAQALAEAHWDNYTGELISRAVQLGRLIGAGASVEDMIKAYDELLRFVAVSHMVHGHKHGAESAKKPT